MQVPSHLVAMGSVYVGFFDTQSSHTVKIYSENFEKRNIEQRTKLTKTNVLIRMIDGINIKKRNTTGADPGFFLGGGALVSCSTSTPINHIFFFRRIPVVLENRRSSQGGGGEVRTPCTLPLDPPL